MRTLGSQSWRNNGTFQPHFAFVDADNMRIGLSQALKRRGFDSEEQRLFQLDAIFFQSQSDRYYMFGAVEDGMQPEDWIKKLRALPSFIFRSGKLKINGGKRKQQGVDVMLAVEALRCANSETMKSCTIFSGDGDLLPLVESLVNFGIITTVATFDDPEKGDVASELRDACDSFVHIGARILSRSIAAEHRLLSIEARVPASITGTQVNDDFGCTKDGLQIIAHADQTVSIIDSDTGIESQPIDIPITCARFNSMQGAILWDKLFDREDMFRL